MLINVIQCFFLKSFCVIWLGKSQLNLWNGFRDPDWPLISRMGGGGEVVPLDLAYAPCTFTYFQWCHTHDVNQLEAHESFGMVSLHGLVFNTKYFCTYTEIKKILLKKDVLFSFNAEKTKLVRHRNFKYNRPKAFLLGWCQNVFKIWHNHCRLSTFQVSKLKRRLFSL